MGGAYGTHEEKQKHLCVMYGNLKERDTLGSPRCRYENIKTDLKEIFKTPGTGFSWLRIWISGRLL
jgi:hypothetical protein